MAATNKQLANSLEVHLIKTLPKLNRNSSLSIGNLSLSTGLTTRNRMTVVEGDMFPRTHQKNQLTDHLGVTLRYDSKLLLSGGCSITNTTENSESITSFGGFIDGKSKEVITYTLDNSVVSGHSIHSMVAVAPYALVMMDNNLISLGKFDKDHTFNSPKNLKWKARDDISGVILSMSCFLTTDGRYMAGLLSGDKLLIVDTKRLKDVDFKDNCDAANKDGDHRKEKSSYHLVESIDKEAYDLCFNSKWLFVVYNTSISKFSKWPVKLTMSHRPEYKAEYNACVANDKYLYVAVEDAIHVHLAQILKKVATIEVKSSKNTRQLLLIKYKRMQLLVQLIDNPSSLNIYFHARNSITKVTSSTLSPLKGKAISRIFNIVWLEDQQIFIVSNEYRLSSEMIIKLN